MAIYDENGRKQTSLLFSKKETNIFLKITALLA